VIGGTARAAAAKGVTGGASRRHTLDEYLAALAEHGGAVVSGIKELMSWCEQNGGRISFNAYGRLPGCFLNWTNQDGKEICPVVVYVVKGGVEGKSKVEVKFRELSQRTPFDDGSRREEFRQRLNRIPDVGLPEDGLTGHPHFPIELIGDTAKRQMLTQALSWFVQELRPSILSA
jgi:hypothetical protein